MSGSYSFPSSVDQIVSINFNSFGYYASFCPYNAPSHQRIVKNCLNWDDSRSYTELNKHLAALLIDKETKQTVATGYKAEETYEKAQEKKEDDKYMYFEHFRHYLYSNDSLEKNTPIPSADGKSTLPLADLITKVFHGIMQHVLSFINGLNAMADIGPINTHNVFWVITVPAICDEMTKQIIRYCAEGAGMEYVEIGPEATVSLYYGVNHGFKLKPHDQICVLDCGARTIDATYIKVQSPQCTLSELYHDSTRCGSIDVDTKCIELLTDLLPKDVVDEVIEDPVQWMRQKNEFKLATISVPFDLEDNWHVPFCFGVNTLLAKKRRNRRDPTYKNIKKFISNYEIPDHYNPSHSVKGSFQLGRSTLKINKNGWLYLHEDVLFKMVTFVRGLFRNVLLSQCHKVVVVGGFANSTYLLNRLMAEFPNKTFFIPCLPHLSVVEGALYWICQPKILITSDQQCSDKDEESTSSSDDQSSLAHESQQTDGGSEITTHTAVSNINCDNQLFDESNMNKTKANDKDKSPTERRLKIMPTLDYQLPITGDAIGSEAPKQDSKEQSLNISSNESTQQETDSEEHKMNIKLWLTNTVNLPTYYSCFVDNGYDTLAFIIDIDNNSELEAIGINKAGHQTRILRQIARLKEEQLHQQHGEVVPHTEVGDFLSSLGFEEYVDAFEKQRLEAMDQLQEITDDYLKEIGVAIAHRRKLKNAIEKHFEQMEEAANNDNTSDSNAYNADIVTQLVHLGFNKQQCIVASSMVMDYNNINSVIDQIQMLQDEDDLKTQNNVYNKKEQRTIQNLLTICIAIGEYAHKEDLYDVCPQDKILLALLST